MRFKAGMATVIMTIAVVGMAWWDHQTYYQAYKEGRKSMYSDMVGAAGGKPGARLEVHYNDTVSSYHEASICATCHTS